MKELEEYRAALKAVKQLEEESDKIAEEITKLQVRKKEILTSCYPPGAYERLAKAQEALKEALLHE